MPGELDYHRIAPREVRERNERRASWAFLIFVGAVMLVGVSLAVILLFVWLYLAFR